MKKLTALLLILATLWMTSCGGALKSGETKTTDAKTAETASGTDSGKETRKVPSPAQMPDYSFDHEPTVDEMRQTAIRAMRDMLVIQWYPEKTVKYNKEGAVSQKNYEFYTERYYMGLPYTSAGMGIFQFLAFYDSETGCLHYTDQASFNETIGNSCASSTAWGLLSVCNSVKGGSVSNLLTISNGYLPLGGVDYDHSITDFSEYFTKQIVKDNGEAKVLAGYAAVQPGDILFYGDNSEGRGHTRMAIEKPEVVYKNGAVDPDNSFVTVQEQATADVEDTSTGITMTRSGQIEAKYSFRSLLNDGYIAVTTAEFLGQKAYEKCAVSFEGDRTTLEGLLAGTVHSNYPMAVLKLVVHADGKDTVLKQTLFNRKMIGDGTALEYALSSTGISAATDRRIPKSGAFTVSVEVTTSTGETFTPVTVSVNK